MLAATAILANVQVELFVLNLIQQRFFLNAKKTLEIYFFEAFFANFCRIQLVLQAIFLNGLLLMNERSSAVLADTIPFLVLFFFGTYKLFDTFKYLCILTILLLLEICMGLTETSLTQKFIFF